MAAKPVIASDVNRCVRLVQCNSTNRCVTQCRPYSVQNEVA
jgi:hypothetical protein